MKKTLIFLMMVLLSAMLIISCDDASGSSTKATYMVTFRLGESSSTGSAFDAQEIVEGEKAKKPDVDPKATDTHKTFDFWSVDGTTEFKFNETPITKDVMLQAVYRDYEVGDTGPAGGKIFYVAASEQSSTYNNIESITWKCLEAAPLDISGTFIWGVQGSDCMGSKGTGTAIGDGWSNTKKLVTYFAAAEACRAYGDNSDYDDWFLPSKGELDEMYNKKDVIGGFDCTSSTGIYWSSSEPDSAKAYATCFYNGLAQGYERSGGSYKIRPIRAF